MKRMFKKTYLEVDFAENKLENDGVLREKKFGLKEVQERHCKGNREFFKKLSHQSYKTENTRFSRVRQSQN